MDNNLICVYVRSSTGRVLDVITSPDESIEDVKETIAAVTGIASEEIQLSANGGQLPLSDDQRIADYSSVISAGKTIEMNTSDDSKHRWIQQQRSATGGGAGGGAGAAEGAGTTAVTKPSMRMAMEAGRAPPAMTATPDLPRADTEEDDASGMRRATSSWEKS